MTFNERLTALGGYGTKKVEVYKDGIWNDQTIQPVGNRDGYLSDFTSLAINTQLYVFGNFSILYVITHEVGDLR